MVFVFSGTAYITDLISVPTSMGDLAWVDTPITDFTLFASAGRFCSNWYSITDFTMFATTAFKFKFHFSCSFPFISHDTYIVAFIAVATSLINIFCCCFHRSWMILTQCRLHLSWYFHGTYHFSCSLHISADTLTDNFISFLTHIHCKSIEDSISFTISITNFISLITFIADLILVAAYTTDSISFHTSVVDVISFHASSGHIISFATFWPEKNFALQLPLMPQI